MHHAYVSSSLRSFRANKASTFNDYSHLLNQRFDFYRRNPTSCCCFRDHCAFCLSSRVALRPCYLYGIRNLSLLHSRRLVLGVGWGRVRYRYRVEECGSGCGEVYRCVGERRRRRCGCRVDEEEEGESEVCDFSEEFGDVEAVLSLLSEEVEEEGFGRGKNVGLSKRVEEESRTRSLGLSTRVEEERRKSLEDDRRNVGLSKRVDLSGGKRNANLSNRVEEESRGSLGGSRRNLGLSTRVEEERRKSFEGGRRNVSLSKRVDKERRWSLGGRDKGETSRMGREIIESVSKGVQVDLEENDRNERSSRQKRSNARYSSMESNSKQRDEMGMVLGADSYRGRKEASSSSSYHSLSSSGDFDNEVDIKDNHTGEPGSVKYNDLHNDRVRYDGRISEEHRNQRDNTEVGSEITKHRKYIVEGSGMWDCRKKSEKKLTDVVIEETHASKKSAEMHSRVMKTNEKSSGSQQQFDDERRESYCTRGTKEQYSQAGNQVSETETKRTFQEGKEKLDVQKTDAETTSRSPKRQSEQEQNLAMAENLVQETRDEHYKTTRCITQRKETNLDIHKQVSEIQVVDTRTNLDENKNTGQISVKRKEEQWLQTGHHADQNAIQRVQSGKGTNDVAKMLLVLASDTTRNSNTQRTFEKRSSNQESATLLAATSVEETMQSNKRANEKLMQVESRKATISNPQEKDSEEPSSFQASTSMVSQARKQQQDVEERKRSPQAPLLPPHPQSIAREPVHVEFLSESVSPEVSGETSKSNSAVKYESSGGNNNTETPMEILHLSNPEDVLGSAQRLDESSSQFFRDFFEKISYGVSTSEKQTGKRVSGADLVYSGEDYEQKTLTSSCSLAGNDETNDETSYLTNPEDALGSAQRFDMSSSQFVEEFSKIARLEDSTSEEYGMGSVAKTEDSQLKGNKGPAIEMWDVVADTPATSVEETMQSNKRANEKLMQVESRKATVSNPQEKDSEEPSSFQASTSMVSQARKQQQDVEERKRSPQAPLLPPHPQSIAREPVHVEFLSETVSPEVSGETSKSNSAVKYESSGGNNNTETPTEILHHSNPEDVLGSAQRLDESSSQFFRDFFEKISYGVSTSETQTGKRVSGADLVYSGEDYEQKTLTSSCSLAGNDETNDETSYLTNPEDALGSAQRFDMSSSLFVEDLSKIARLEDSTSEEYGMGSVAKTEDSQLKGNKGPEIEMWDVVADTPALKAGEKSEDTKASEKSEAATASVTLEAITTSGNAVAKRMGRSIWNIVADVVKLRWTPHAETHPSAVRSGGKNTTESASSEAWFSGRETEEISEKNVERYKGLLHPVNTFSQTEEAFSTVKSNEEERSSEAATGRKSPAVAEIPNAGYAISGSSSEEIMHRFGHRNFDEESDNVQKDTELKQRKFQRTNQVMKDRFDEWEEAHTRETEQRKADEYFMREALREAKKAADTWEVPVGAVLVQQGKIIARGFNLVEELRDSTAHAEMICIREASTVLKSWRLAECTLYVTLEPCPMCAGAIYQARIDTVVWGAPNKLLGADGSWIRLFPDGGQGSESGQSDKPAAPVHPFHPNITIRRGVLASECSEIMQQFFQLRRRKKEKKQATTPPPSSGAISHHPRKVLTKLHDIFHVMFCL